MYRDIVYDQPNDRLVFLMTAPDQAYWEDLWKPMMNSEALRRGDRFVTAETVKTLPRGAAVVDAGCGIGSTVYGLAAAGYDAHGIDFAEETVATIKLLEPKLQVKVADVRAMPFADGELDGLWSLGVIEHFFEGYDSLIVEANRVLRPGGYMFLTVPIISPLKALKTRLGAYPPYDPDQREQFFQFAFHPRDVISRIEAMGFEHVRGYGRSGSLGLTEDLPGLSRLLMLRLDARSLLARGWWRLVDTLVTPFSHHTRYFLFRKR